MIVHELARINNIEPRIVERMLAMKLDTNTTLELLNILTKLTAERIEEETD